MSLHLAAVVSLLSTVMMVSSAAAHDRRFERYRDPYGHHYYSNHYHDRDRHTEVEAQLALTIGGGWMDGSIGSAAATGMDATWGGTARLGWAIPAGPTAAVVLALHGAVLSMGDITDRFLVSEAAGLFGVRWSLNAEDSDLLVGGLLGLAVSDHRSLMRDSGITFGGLIGYRLDHLFLEARYQVLVFDTRARAPDPSNVASTYVDITIRQVLFSVGFAL